MKKPEVGIPGAFREGGKRFSELRKQKPSKEEVIEIIEKAKKRKEKSQPKKSARPRDLEA